MYHFCVYTFFLSEAQFARLLNMFRGTLSLAGFDMKHVGCVHEQRLQIQHKKFPAKKNKDQRTQMETKPPNEKLKMMRRSPLNFQLKKKRASTFYMAVCAIHSFHLKYVYFSSEKIVLISWFSAFTFHSLYFPSRAHFTTFPNFAAHFCSVRLSQPLSCIIDINRARALAIILPSSEMLRDFFFSFQTNYL